MFKKKSHRFLLAMDNTHISIAVFLLWGLITSVQFYILGENSYIRIHDNGDSSHPLVYADTHFPNLSEENNWCHYSLCGMDGISNNGAFGNSYYLLYSFFQRVAPGWLGFALLMFLQRFLAGLFMFLVARRMLKLSPFASLCAGLLYPFLWALNYLGIYHQLAEPGIPFYLYCMDLLLKSKQLIVKILFSFLLGLFFTFCSLLLHSQPFIIVVLLFFLLIIGRYKITTLIPIFIPFFVAMFILDIQAFISMWEIKDGTQRLLVSGFKDIPTLYESIYNMVHKGIGLFLREGILIILCFIGITFGVLRNRTFRWVSLGFIFCGFITYLIPYFIFNLLGISFFRGIQLDRFYHDYFFFLTLATAISIDHSSKVIRTSSMFDNQIKLKNTILLLLLSAVGILFAFKFYQECRIFQTQILSGLSLGFLGYRQTAQVIVGILTLSAFVISFVFLYHRKDEITKWINLSLLVILPLFVFLQWFENSKLIFTKERYKKLYHPQEYDLVKNMSGENDIFRVATAYPTSLSHPAFALVSGLETVDGYYSLYPARYHLFWRKVIEGVRSRSEEVKNYFDSWGQRVYLFAPKRYQSPPDDLSISEAFNLDLLSLANVKYFFSKFPLEDERLTLIDDKKSDDFYVYQNQNILPRFFLVNRVIIFPDSIMLLDSLANADIVMLGTVAFIESLHLPHIPDSTLSLKSATLQLDHYSSDLIKLNVKNDSESLLIVTNNWSPYWKAKVNGAPSIVYPADFTFQCVFVPSGTNKVELIYSR